MNLEIGNDGRSLGSTVTRGGYMAT